MWNSLIHTVMYFYFGLSGVGIKLNFLRPFITSMQIGQFVTGMTFLFVTYRAAMMPGGECATPGRSFGFCFQ